MLTQLLLILSLGATSSQFTNFILSLSGKNDKEREAIIQTEMNRLSATPEDYKKLYDTAAEILDSFDSPQRDESLFIPFLRNAVNSPALGEADRERARYRLSTALKNRPGEKAPDFSFIDRSGKTSSLYSFSDSDMVLMFYDPDCDHCREVMEEMRKNPINGVRILAIDAEEDQDLWEATNSDLPLDWTVGFAKDAIQDQETYVFQTMPALYLLDNRHTVILKDATLPQIRAIVK